MGIDTTIPVIEQIRWERNMAIEQLSQIGKGLGERMDDVVKVVRCKNCKYSSHEPYKDQADVYACNYNHYWRRRERVRLPDDFCSKGERRTDDN